MKARVAKGGCWPTRQQELFLRAVLLRGPESLAAWRRWQVNADIDTLESGSQRLLPMLFHSLKKQGVTDPIIDRFKGIYRRTWYQNQLLFQSTAKLLRDFHKDGIRTLLLKGAALALRYYSDPGLRPMEDVDVLVPLAQARSALNLLRKWGWEPDQLGPGRHAWGFKNKDGWQVDLHWHVLQDSGAADVTNPFWAGAIPAQLHGVPTLVLNNTDQLLHVCVHGLRWSEVPPLRWIADAAMILKVSGAEIDWNRLMALAKQRQLVLPMRDALNYLHKKLEIPVPCQVLSELNHTRAAFSERVSYDSRVFRKLSIPQRLQLWASYFDPESGSIPIKMIDVMKDLRQRWYARKERVCFAGLVSDHEAA